MEANETKSNTEKKRNRLKWDAKQAKKSAASTGVTMAAAAGGAFIGSQLGRWSLFAGGVAALAGNYIERPWVTTLGAAVFAGGVVGVMKGLNSETAKKEPFSISAKLAEAKEEAAGFAQALKRTLFLDKLAKPREEAAEPLQGVDYSHFDTLDKLEQNLLASAVAFNAANPHPPATLPPPAPDMDRY